MYIFSVTFGWFDMSQKDQKEIKYHPENVKDLLKEMKDISELMVDLSYSALMFDNEYIADEVLKLEERMDVLLYHARIAAILSARSVEEAEKLSGILQVASAAEKISNAAGDIAKIVLANLKLPDMLKFILQEAEETVTRVKLSSDSEFSNKTLGEIRVKSETGMKVIAIRRDLEWIYNPNRDTKLIREDIIFAKGPDEGVPIFYELASSEKYSKKVFDSEDKINALENAADLIIQMKNTSELAVGLAYSAVLFHSKDIAYEVQLLENQMDNMKNRLESQILESAKHVKSTNCLRGLLQLGISSEIISDAAYEISDIVLRNIELHPVFVLAVRESDEVITSIDVKKSSEMAGKTLGSLKLETETGMFVLAIRRENRWIFHPGSKTIISGGDSLIAKGMKSGEKLLSKMGS